MALAGTERNGFEGGEQLEGIFRISAGTSDLQALRRRVLTQFVYVSVRGVPACEHVPFCLCVCALQ